MSEAYDMAIVCVEAAQDYMKANPDFEIVAPVIYNSDIVVESDRDIKKVGVTNNKDFHKDFAKKIYGEDVEVIGIIPNSLPFAYKNEQIDAMIIDITAYYPKTMEGRVRQVSKEDYVSNVLIARSDFMKTKTFDDFIEKYNETVDNINTQDFPVEYIQSETKIDERSLKYWKVILTKIN